MPSAYKGLVGAKPRQRKPRVAKDKKSAYKCKNGPLEGYVLFLTADGTTAQMNVSGQIGRYNRGVWEAVCI